MELRCLNFLEIVGELPMNKLTKDYDGYITPAELIRRTTDEGGKYEKNRG